MEGSATTGHSVQSYPRRLIAVPALQYLLWLATVALVCLSPTISVAEEPTDVRVGVLHSSLAAVLHAVALEEGYYAKNGLNVKQTYFNSGDGTAGAESLLRGGLDVYIGTLAEITRINAQAIEAHQAPPLAAVAAGNPSPSTLVLRDNIPFSSVSDLKGLKLGVSSLGSEHLVTFRYFLAEKGLTTEALGIQLVRVAGPDMPPALLSRQIDGFLHSEPTVTIAVLKAHGKVAMARTDFGAASNAPALGVIVSRSWAATHRPIVADVVHALWQATNDYPTLNKADVEKIFTDYIHADPEVVAAAYPNVDPRLYDLHKMADAHFQIDIPAMVKRGEVTVELKESDIFDFSYSP
jgi:NitT/TauT family transport system substrate-binding protein